MKYLMSITSLALLILLFTACKEDGADFTLQYDGDNNTAPALSAATFESGVKFPASFDGNDVNNELYAVELFIEQIPTTAQLRVYLGSNTDDGLVYSKSILREMNNSDWLTHTLATPLVLDGTDLWVTLRYEQDADVQVLGCDDGPQKSVDSNWHYDSTDQQWQTFNERNGADINWNIRALVSVPEE